MVSAALRLKSLPTPDINKGVLLLFGIIFDRIQKKFPQTVFFEILTLKIFSFLASIDLVWEKDCRYCGKCGRVGWRCLHSDNDRGFKAHYDAVIESLENTLHGNLLCVVRVLETHCRRSSGNIDTRPCTTMFNPCSIVCSDQKFCVTGKQNILPSSPQALLPLQSPFPKTTFLCSLNSLSDYLESLHRSCSCNDVRGLRQSHSAHLRSA